MDKLIGHQVRGYEIREQLGGGGYGAVYRAFQTAVGRDVAIKVILPQHAENLEFTRRFEVEAQLVAQLEHPHIVPLYDYWQDENGAFLVMRLVRGGSLRDLLNQHERLDFKQILRVYDHIGSALEVSHAAGVIHRDIKPDNILLDQYDNAYLTDFGIAKNLNLKTQLTFNEDSIIGTPAYLSPEQIRNDPVSTQTDIYSFGLMLYELVTGRQPFEGQGIGIIASHLEKEVPSVLASEPDVPEALDTIIRRAAAKSANDRYASITQMLEELREAFAPAIVPILPYEAQPRYKDPNRHVFVTYSPGDTAFIQRLTYDLDSEGVPVWVDKQHLKPGTRGWEDSRREAIRSAYAVILVASPETRRSDYVQDELAIAEMYNCPVYPVWAAGDNWSAILPTGVDTGERIDARGDQYSQALLELVMLLGTYTPESDTEEIIIYGLSAAETFVPRNPYKGLRAFREDDQADFFGRAGLVNLLLDTLNGLLQPGESRLLAVIGPSGSGKSSVVMAGLLPALRGGSLPESERWTYLPPFVPGATPLENLTIALASVLPNKSAQAIEEDLKNPSARGLHLLARQAVDRQNSRLVLYVDQFEELFTQTGDEAERQQFINLLLTAVSEPGGPVVVLLTLRADFYDRPMNYPELGRLIERNSKAVLPMSLAELYSVIQKPAALPDVALQFDTGLVADLVFEVRGQPGGLPLLQFTLDQLFDRRSGQRLTNAAYEEIGGVRGALAKHTETTYQNLPSDEHRHMVRGLFLRLIEPGATEQDTTRRRAPRSELVLADARQNRIMDDVINAFVNARLLLADQSKGVTTIEVSHEALIREWPRLSDWLNEARADIFTQQNISADTAAWISRGRRADDDGLYRGMLLEDAQRWAERNLPSSDEMAFLTTSAQAQAARQARDAAIARRVQNFRRAAALLGVMSLVAIIAFVGAVVQVGGAQSQLGTATVAQGVAILAQNTAVAQVGAAQTNVADVGQTLTPISQVLAIAQTDVAGVEPTVRAANQAAGDARTQVANAEVILTRVPMTLTPIAGTLVAAETGVAAVGPTVNAANFTANMARTEVANAGLTLTPIPLTLTPIGGTLAAAEQQVAGVQPTLNAANTQVAGIEPTVLAANDAANIARQQAADAAQTLTPVPQTLTPISQTLAAAEQQIAGVQPTLASAQTQVAGIQPTVQAANFAADTARTAVANTGLTLTPIPQTLTPIAGTLAAAETQVAGVQPTVNAAGTQVAAVEPTVQAANFAADDARTQVANAGGTLTPIPLTLTPIAGTLAAAETQVAGVQPTVNAAGTAVAGVEPTVMSARTQVAEAGAALTPLAVTLEAANTQVALNASQALSQSLAVNAEQAVNNDDNDLALVLALESIRANPSLVQSQRLLNQLVYASARFSFDQTPVAQLSPDGTSLATASGNTVTLWDIVTRSKNIVFTASGTINAIDISADGTKLVAAGADGKLTLWDAVTGQSLREFVGHTGSVNAVQFSPDGNSILSGGDDDLNIIWSTGDGSERSRNSLQTNRQIIRVQYDLGGQSFWSWERANQEVIMVYWVVGRNNPRWTSADQLFDAFDPRNMRYAFSEKDRTLVVWDAPTLAKTREFQNAAINGLTLTARGFSPVGSLVLTAFRVPGTATNRVILWDFGSSAIVNTFELQSDSSVGSITYSPDGLLAALGVGKTIVLYDMVNFRELQHLAAHTDLVSRMEFSQDGKYLLSFSSDGNARVWDIAGGDPAQLNRITARTQNNLVTFPGISPDGQTVFGVLRVSTFAWSANTGEQVNRIDIGGDIIGAAYSPTQPYILTISANSASVWDMSKPPNQALVRYMGGQDDVFQGVVGNNITLNAVAAFSPDGQYVVMDSRSLSLRDIATNGRQVDLDRSPIPPGNGLVSLAISPDNRLVLGVYAQSYAPGVARDPNEPAGGVIVWDVATGQALRQFGSPEHNRRINHVAISPDNRLALTASGDGTLIVWDIETGRLLRRLAGHRGAVNLAYFLPDGRYAVSASDDTALILWDVQTGQLLRRFYGHKAPVTGLAIRSDGAGFVSNTGNDHITVWELESIEQTVEWTRQNRFVRQLTCEEGRQYGLDDFCSS